MIWENGFKNQDQKIDNLRDHRARPSSDFKNVKKPSDHILSDENKYSHFKYLFEVYKVRIQVLFYQIPTPSCMAF